MIGTGRLSGLLAGLGGSSFGAHLVKLQVGSLGLTAISFVASVLLARTWSRYWFHQAPPVVGTPAKLGPTISVPGISARSRWWVRRHSSKYWLCGRFQKRPRLGSFQMSHCTGTPVARTSAKTRVRKLS